MTDTREREQPEQEHDLEYDRYRIHEAEDGSVMLYDGQKNDAWIRSDTAVAIRE